MGNSLVNTSCVCPAAKDREPDSAGHEPCVPVIDDGDSNPDAEQESEQDDQEEWVLPSGGQMTLMMFGMSGAGKSALGNLIAGCNAFECGDDTSSMTSLDSVVKFKAEDDSLT